MREAGVMTCNRLRKVNTELEKVVQFYARNNQPDEDKKNIIQWSALFDKYRQELEILLSIPDHPRPTGMAGEVEEVTRVVKLMGDLQEDASKRDLTEEVRIRFATLVDTTEEIRT